MIYNPPTSPYADYYLGPFEAAGLPYGIQTSAVGIHAYVEIKSALAREPEGGLVVLPEGIICGDIFEFESYMPSHAVGLCALCQVPASPF